MRKSSKLLAVLLTLCLMFGAITAIFVSASGEAKDPFNVTQRTGNYYQAEYTIKADQSKANPYAYIYGGGNNALMAKMHPVKGAEGASTAVFKKYRFCNDIHYLSLRNYALYFHKLVIKHSKADKFSVKAINSYHFAVFRLGFKAQTAAKQFSAV